MAMICQQTGTISGSYSLLCGKLIKIYDIRRNYGTIDVLIEGQISPQVGDNAFTIGNERIRIALISKNVAYGTAEVQITISTVEIPPPPPPIESTHRLEFYVKPHSWYSVGGAAEDITLKLSSITGTIINIMSDAGLTNWQYVSTEILTDTQSNKVTIRVNLNELSGMGYSDTGYSDTGYSDMGYGIQSMPIVFTPGIIIAIALGVVIIGIGTIVGWAIVKGVQQLLGDNFTGKQVGEHDKAILENIKKNCKTNFPSNPVGYANCTKSGAQSVSEASGDFFNDPTIAEAGDNAAAHIDTCIEQYNTGQISAAQLVACSDKAVDDTGDKIIDKTKDKDSGSGALILLGAALVGLYIVSKSGEK